MNSIKKSLLKFDRINLYEINKVKLMNRVDRKYCLHKSRLEEILDLLFDDYYVLEIIGETIQPYKTTYFDLPDDKMYMAHQNGKLNRHKIRIRKYNLTNEEYLEIKIKNNIGRSIKKRIKFNSDSNSFSGTEQSFLHNNTPYHAHALVPKIDNSFNRVTLISKQFNERVTIDILPYFKNDQSELLLNNLAIIEVKQGKYGQRSIIVEVLKKNKIRKQRISKYCIGRALLEENIKKNRFKPKLIRINKYFT